MYTNTDHDTIHYLCHDLCDNIVHKLEVVITQFTYGYVCTDVCNLFTSEKGC